MAGINFVIWLDRFSRGDARWKRTNIEPAFEIICLPPQASRKPARNNGVARSVTICFNDSITIKSKLTGRGEVEAKIYLASFGPRSVSRDCLTKDVRDGPKGKDPEELLGEAAALM